MARKGRPKGPRMNPEVLNRLTELAVYRPDLVAKEIRDMLVSEFGENSVLQLRRMQFYISEYRQEAKENIQEKPWSLAMMATGQTDIPWEAARFLLQAYNALWRRQEVGKGLPWRWSAHPLDDFYKGSPDEIVDALISGSEIECVSIMPLAPRAPPGTVLTNRQAKWLWRIHLMLPLRSVPGWDLLNLCERVDEYTQRELLSDYLNEDFDSSDLDSSLTNVLRSTNKTDMFVFADEEADE